MWALFLHVSGLSRWNCRGFGFLGPFDVSLEGVFFGLVSFYEL